MMASDNIRCGHWPYTKQMYPTLSINLVLLATPIRYALVYLSWTNLKLLTLLSNSCAQSFCARPRISPRQLGLE